jgi:hypothetical protein
MTSDVAQCSRIAGRKSAFTLAKNCGPRTWKPLAVFVVAACVAIHGQSSPKQMADPAVAALGGGFVSDTVQVNGTTLHYVRGGAGPAIILLHGFLKTGTHITASCRSWRSNSQSWQLTCAV